MGTFREHFLGKYFLTNSLYGKVAFVLKMHDLTKTDVDFLENSNNHKAMFPEYSKNIP